jgi:membrane protein DedA with SNARE-associated domain
MYLPFWGKRKKMNYWPFVILNSAAAALVVDIILTIFYLVDSNSKPFNESPIPWLFLIFLNILAFGIETIFAHRYWNKNYKQLQNNSNVSA